jgi:thiol-disulfide isomerase/thioredoxin
MDALTASGGRSRRLWILALVAGIAVIGIWWSSSRHTALSGDSVTLGSGRPQLLDFGMGVCVQCKRMKPVMEQVAHELGHVLDVHTLDIRQEENELLAEHFKMTTMPLIVLVDGAGNELWRHEGFVDFMELSKVVEDRLGSKGRTCAAKTGKCEP